MERAAYDDENPLQMCSPTVIALDLGKSGIFGNTARFSSAVSRMWRLRMVGFLSHGLMKEYWLI